MVEEQKEKAPVSVSSSLLLSVDYRSLWKNRLVLVKQKETGGWGLVAGKYEYSPGANLVESTYGTISRELFEETDIEAEQVKNLSYITEVYSPKANYMGIGFIFGGTVDKAIRNFSRGYTPRNKNEISRVKGFTIDQISKLVFSKPEMIYKPEYNIPLLKYWAFKAVWRKYSVYDGNEFGLDAAEGRTGFSRDSLNIHHAILTL